MIERVQTKWVDTDHEIEDDVVTSMSHVLQALVGSPRLPPNIALGLTEFDHKMRTYLPLTHAPHLLGCHALPDYKITRASKTIFGTSCCLQLCH